MCILSAATRGRVEGKEETSERRVAPFVELRDTIREFSRDILGHVAIDTLQSQKDR